MRPQSAYGRGQKPVTVSDSFKQSRPGTAQFMGIVGKSPVLSNEEISKELIALKQNEFDVLKATMKVQFDATEKRSEQTKKIIVNSYEQQCEQMIKQHERNLDVLRVENDKMIERLVEKHRKDIQNLESEHETTINRYKDKIVLIEKQKDQSDSDYKQQINDLSKQIEQFNKSEQQNVVAKQSLADKCQILSSKNDEKQSKLLELEINLKEKCEQLQLVQKQVEEQEVQFLDLQKQLEHSNQQIKKLQQFIQLQEEKNQYSQEIIHKQVPHFRNHQIQAVQSSPQQPQIYLNAIEKSELPFPQEQKEVNNYDDNMFQQNQQEEGQEEDLMGLERLQSDLTQSIQFQIEMLRSKSAIAANSQPSIKTYQYSSSKGYYQGSSLQYSDSEQSGYTLKVPKDVSIGLFSEDLFNNNLQNNRQNKYAQNNGNVINELDELINVNHSLNYEHQQQLQSQLQLQLNHSINYSHLTNQPIAEEEGELNDQNLHNYEEEISQLRKDQEQYQLSIEQLQDDRNNLQNQLQQTNNQNTQYIQDLQQLKTQLLEQQQKEEVMLEQVKQKIQRSNGLTIKYKSYVSCLLNQLQSLQQLIDATAFR